MTIKITQQIHLKKFYLPSLFTFVLFVSFVVQILPVFSWLDLRADGAEEAYVDAVVA